MIQLMVITADTRMATLVSKDSRENLVRTCCQISRQLTGCRRASDVVFSLRVLKIRISICSMLRLKMRIRPSGTSICSRCISAIPICFLYDGASRSMAVSLKNVASLPSSRMLSSSSSPLHSSSVIR